MKEIVVISGKGGTGKTSLTAAFAVLGGQDPVVADCDVDAADMHLLLEPDFAHEESFFSGELAVIDQAKCSDCGLCEDVCRYGAVDLSEGRYMVDEIGCEGCGYCARVCPDHAITNIEQHVGQWYRSAIRTKTTMIHARLKIGADNSGKLVAQVKKVAREVAKSENKNWILVDGPPGVGCPVISSLSGASLAVLVTEPTVAGLHDLRRVQQLVKAFGIKSSCVINKADLNPDVRGNLRRFLAEEKIPVLAEIPYNEQFTSAMTNGKTIVEWDAGLEQQVRGCWEKVSQLADDR
ncbi:MAG: ATP-binding protein [Xanthomonadales bacterium]|jgi:MinD superfamily P-loop ATPase|nr:ATP-binding protein [Xanthomonadales bacterium]